MLAPKAGTATRAGPGAPVASPRILVVANQKGGVGKTTTTVNLAAALALIGHRVLVVDLDPQGNASTALSLEHAEGTPGSYEVLIEDLRLERVVTMSTHVQDLFGVPATADLAGAEIELVAMPNRELRLRGALFAALERMHERGQSFDFVFLDCPPSLGLITVNALAAAQELVVPIQCEYYALEGLGQLLRTMQRVKVGLNPDLCLSAIVLTMYDGRTRLAASVADEVRQHFGDVVFSTTIPRSVRVSEAPSYGQTVLTYDPSSAGARSYRQLAGELCQRKVNSRVGSGRLEG